MGHAKVDPNLTVDMGDRKVSVLEKMIAHRYLPAVRTLLEFPTIDLRQSNCRAYLTAVYSTDEVFKAMVDTEWVDFNVDVGGDEGRCTLLDVVVNALELQKLKLLLSRKGYDPCRKICKDVEGQHHYFPSPLHYLLYDREENSETSKHVFDLLLNVDGMDVNAQCDLYGQAPLHLALLLRKENLVSSLLRHPKLDLTLEMIEEPRSALALAKQKEIGRAHV